MTRTVCAPGLCSGCRCCLDACTHGAVTYVDSLEHCDAVIDEQLCTACGACERVCPISNPTTLRIPTNWVQGWAEPANVRAASSSGGLAAAISQAFVIVGGVVCSCVFEAGQFGFEAAEDANGLAAFRGSKYVKSDASGVYRQVRGLLNEGRRVLFIGLPCQVSAMQSFVGKRLAAKLYTADLICHGTPSPKLLEAFLSQKGYPLEKLSDVQFRRKSTFRLADGEHALEPTGVCDAYSLAFLAGFTYTHGCYSCPFACGERAGDLTLGDSWGTELGEGEVGRGVSLVLCQGAKGEELLRAADVYLQPVDAEKARANNAQLNAPSAMPEGRERFFELFQSGMAFERVAWRMLPKRMLKQRIKTLLIKLKLWPGGGSLMYSISVVAKRELYIAMLDEEDGE